MKEETTEKGRQGSEWKRPCCEGDQLHKKWGKMFGGKLEEVGRRAGRGDHLYFNIYAFSSGKIRYLHRREKKENQPTLRPMRVTGKPNSYYRF
jgi:hypothetical protein